MGFDAVVGDATSGAAPDGTRAPLQVPHGELALCGPSDKTDRSRTPARGDLAHIRLAGRCFVPHYAVPITYSIAMPATLHAAPRSDALAIADIARGALFEALDIAGEWAWGQLAQEDELGLVGYIRLTALVRP